MAGLLQIKLFKSSNGNWQTLRRLHVNVIRLNKKWRAEKRLPINPNTFGPLTNLPDYSFKDGRVVPYGSNQKRRIDLQRQNLLKIKQLVGEIDYAVEKHARLQKQIIEEKQQILHKKLKEKGDKLIVSHSINKDQKI